MNILIIIIQNVWKDSAIELKWFIVIRYQWLFSDELG